MDIPENINFSSQILKLYSLNEIGISEIITRNAQPKTIVNVGDWVNRGDLIVEIDFVQYSNITKPKGLFKSDRIENCNFQLTSPISGLVIGFLSDEVIDMKSHQKWDIIGKRPTKIFPIILVPEFEPQSLTIDNFYNQIRQYLLHNFRKLSQLNYGGGHIRLLSKNNTTEIINLDENIEFDMCFEEFEMVKNQFYLINHIEYLRANNHLLRDKLLHLVKDNYKSNLSK